jgi:hypothetical protein
MVSGMTPAGECNFWVMSQGAGAPKAFQHLIRKKLTRRDDVIFSPDFPNDLSTVYFVALADSRLSDEANSMAARLKPVWFFDGARGVCDS